MKPFVTLACLSLLAGAFAQTADKKQLDALAASLQSAKVAYKKHPSATTKHLLVVATDRLATATMTSEALTPRVRYPDALGLYQQALNLEPNNFEAKNNATMIDSVYKGMIDHARSKMKSDPKAAADYARLTGVYKKIHRPIP